MMRRHLIKGGKDKEVFPTFTDVLNSITFGSGPTRWGTYGMGKRKAYLHIGNGDTLMGQHNGGRWQFQLYCLYISRGPNFHIKLPNPNTSSIWLELESSQPAEKHPQRKATIEQFISYSMTSWLSNKYNPLSNEFIDDQYTGRDLRWLHSSTILSCYTEGLAQHSKKAHPTESDFRIYTSAQHHSYQNTTGVETNLRLPAQPLSPKRKSDKKISASI